MLSEKEVLNCCELLLGRIPKNKQIIQFYIKNFPTIEHLTHSILHSEDFLYRFPYLQNVLTFDKRIQRKLLIEYNDDLSYLEKIFLEIKDSWDILLQKEPYWGILANDKFRFDQVKKEGIQEFFHSGKNDIEIFEKILYRHDLNFDWSSKECMDFGAGIGRVALELQKKVKKLYAVDISEHCIVYMKKKMMSNRNEPIYLSKLLAIRQLPVVDVIVSILTFQHNPEPLNLFIINNLLQKLKPSGYCIFQIVTYSKNYSFDSTLTTSQELSNPHEVHVTRQPKIFELIRQNNCHLLEIIEDSWIVKAYSISNTFVIQKSNL